jgi:hypothetical protein
MGPKNFGAADDNAQRVSSIESGQLKLDKFVILLDLQCVWSECVKGLDCALARTLKPLQMSIPAWWNSC